ncbi:hypothetical protein PUR71_02935, partial [Streptomyces sp. SP17BM10]|uniref:hypothetical protein n=1 Tax=Streptomyces sp. SP17BM10 TaxID=3002530 RepID=UPI002E7823BA
MVPRAAPENPAAPPRHTPAVLDTDTAPAADAAAQRAPTGRRRRPLEVSDAQRRGGTQWRGAPAAGGRRARGAGGGEPFDVG